MSAHAKYSASSLERLTLCPASARMSEGIEDKTSEAAAKGTRIHALGEALLLGLEIPEDAAEDELAVAREYATYVHSIGGEERWVELAVHAGLATIHPDLGGTADCVIKDGNILHVIDLKTGKSPVAAKNNSQLMTYALGALKELNITDINVVEMHIYQPENHSTYAVHVDVLKEWEKKLLQITEAADDPFAQPNPTSKGCHFCKGKVVCPAMREKVLESAKADFSESNLERLLDEAEMAMAWAESIKEMAKAHIAAGADGGHWSLRNGRKMLSWKSKVAVEAYFAGEPRAFEIKSVAALKKEGFDIPADYIEEKISAPSLVRKS